MTGFWQAIGEHIVRNEEEYITLATALGIATIIKMPPQIPKTFQDWWTWIRDALQTATPAARASQEAHTSTTITTPTTSTAKEATVTTAADPTPPKGQ
jgi:hypothetical protein